MSDRRAFIFPGQASQYVGMAQDLYEKFSLARELFARANVILGFDIQQICFFGPEEKLTQTDITQPAIFIHSAIVTRLLAEKGIVPHMVAGHSLGEYSALFAAGVLDFEDALTLVKRRGELMQRAGVENPGTMAAIVGLEPVEVEAICQEASSAGIVCAANFNSPGQIAISGSVAGVQQAMAIAKAKGAKIVKQLAVGGAFHSPLMASARDGLRASLHQVHFREATCPIYLNVTAKPTQNVEELRQRLDEQLTSPVRWVEIIENMIADGATQFYEVGPGNVLAGLLKRINKNFVAKTVGKVVELEAI
ncbi:MAG: ACP S-malonyltransferase [candidate division KSB1 bacterium]|nr:ACP S-malonyltransferase [candidate division KSB1 bacterium]MDZ7301842.1 ACP S-malonyltransferase [candidate division KSB1 bacterium]MDZ7310225.1 ACP S-malonyltransferase [candidate division KSB1 bacterium]